MKLFSSPFRSKSSKYKQDMLHSAHWRRKMSSCPWNTQLNTQMINFSSNVQPACSAGWCPGFCQPKYIHHVFPNLRAVSRTNFWCSFEWWQFQLVKVLIWETRLPQIGNLAVRYLKYGISMSKISGLRWFFTNRGRKFFLLKLF